MSERERPVAVLDEAGGPPSHQNKHKYGALGCSGTGIPEQSPLIGVTDRSNNKPYSVFPRSGCPPPRGQRLEGSVLCQCEPLFDCASPPSPHPSSLCSSGPSWSDWTIRHQRTQRLAGTYGVATCADDGVMLGSEAVWQCCCCCCC